MVDFVIVLQNGYVFEYVNNPFFSVFVFFCFYTGGSPKVFEIHDFVFHNLNLYHVLKKLKNPKFHQSIFVNLATNTNFEAYIFGLPIKEPQLEIGLTHDPNH